jgi:hypothetical protein
MLFVIESMRAPRVGVSKVTSTCNPTRIIKTFSHCDAVKEIDKFVTIAGRETSRRAQELTIQLILRRAGVAATINQDQPRPLPGDQRKTFAAGPAATVG